MSISMNNHQKIFQIRASKIKCAFALFFSVISFLTALLYVVFIPLSGFKWILVIVFLLVAYFLGKRPLLSMIFFNRTIDVQHLEGENFRISISQPSQEINRVLEAFYYENGESILHFNDALENHADFGFCKILDKKLIVKNGMIQDEQNLQRMIKQSTNMKSSHTVSGVIKDFLGMLQ